MRQNVTKITGSKVSEWEKRRLERQRLTVGQLPLVQQRQPEGQQRLSVEQRPSVQKRPPVQQRQPEGQQRLSVGQRQTVQQSQNRRGLLLYPNRCGFTSTIFNVFIDQKQLDTRSNSKSSNIPTYSNITNVRSKVINARNFIVNEVKSLYYRRIKETDQLKQKYW